MHAPAVFPSLYKDSPLHTETEEAETHGRRTQQQQKHEAAHAPATAKTVLLRHMSGRLLATHCTRGKALRWGSRARPGAPFRPATPPGHVSFPRPACPDPRSSLTPAQPSPSLLRRLPPHPASSCQPLGARALPRLPDQEEFQLVTSGGGREGGARFESSGSSAPHGWATEPRLLRPLRT